MAHWPDLTPLWPILAPVLSVACVTAIGCGARQGPPPPVAEDFIEVEYPPPPAQVEEMTESLAGRPECIWQDGHYEWSGRRYRWISGRWVVPPADCLHAPAVVTWAREAPARLYYTPPRWYRAEPSASSRSVGCASPIPCLSQRPTPP